MPLLVLITGTGRSGTSTMSGSLHHLGLHVPGPYLGANESNPKGFFESRWSVRFHNALTKQAGIHIFDSRPDALDRVRAVISDQHRADIVDYLNRRGEGQDQMVVKDPRTVWTQDLWRQAAADVGREIGYVSMLRHPAETTGSRATYYASDDLDKRRRYETFNVARWVNNALTNERSTRGQRRVFVRYTDLLKDWRPVVVDLGDRLGLRYDPGVDTRPHPVDDFIDPGLRRHRITWDDLELPDVLQAIAEEVWLCIDALVDDPDRDVAEHMDGLAGRYARLLRESAAISHDAIEEATANARRNAAAAVAKETEAAEQAARDLPLEQRPVAEVGGRDLLKVAAGRALGRLRR